MRYWVSASFGSISFSSHWFLLKIFSSYNVSAAAKSATRFSISSLAQFTSGASRARVQPSQRTCRSATPPLSSTRIPPAQVGNATKSAPNGQHFPDAGLEVFGQRHLIDGTGDPRFRQPVFHLFDLALHLRIVNAGQRVALRDLVALVGHNLHHARRPPPSSAAATQAQRKRSTRRDSNWWSPEHHTPSP